MSEPIYWSQSNFTLRRAVVELNGWCNRHGNATKTGERIANTEWAQLTPAARNILIRAGIQP
jgi:hypothetical protein